MTLLEPTLAVVYHPETLRVDSIDGVTHLQRVDHPVVGPLQDGAPGLGWEGDNRLCMYLDGRANVWVLMRLEADFEYRVVTVSPIGRQLSEAEVNQLIRRLQAHDVRKGFDPKAAVDQHNDAVDAEKARVSGDKLDSMADKLAWGIKRDVGQHY